MKKDLVAIGIILMAFFIFILCSDFQTVDEYYAKNIQNVTEDSDTFFLEIDCSTILNNMEKLDKGLADSNYVPADGIILAKTEYVLRPNDSVYTALCRVLKANKIPLDATGNNGSNMYIKGINYIYEFSCEALSGWLYAVNGVFPTVACSEQKISDGDTIRILYSCDLGEDVGKEVANG